MNGFLKSSSIFLLVALFVTNTLANDLIFEPHGAPLVPGQIRVMIKDDPAHQMVVGWNNYTSFVKQTTLYYDTQDHGQNVNAYRFKKQPDASWVYKMMSNTFVVLNNLRPDTRYYFVIKNGDGVSRRYFFETLPSDPNARISVISGGDSRNNRGPRKKANRIVAKLRPHFVMFGGDMTNLGFSFEWIQWMNDWQETIAADGRVTPVAIVRGNHERGNDVLEQLFFAKKGLYYSFSVATDLIRVYNLNSESSIAGDQTGWLEADLQANKESVWKFAQYHRPMRPHVGKKKDQAMIYKYWAPLFFQYGMSLVFESDAHTVKSTWPIKPDENGEEGFVIDELFGTVYVGEGCWGAPLRRADAVKSWTREAGSFNQIKWTFIDRNAIELRTIKVDGEAKVVGHTTNATRFEIPEGIELWNAGNGEVYKILNRREMVKSATNAAKKLVEAKYE